MIKVGILGAAGYTGGELIRLLINHPEVEIVFANSESNAGNAVADVHEGLLGDTDLKFTDGAVMSAGLLIAVAFVAIIVGSLKNMFSK